MDHIFHFARDAKNSGLLDILFSAAVAVSTVVYAFITYHLYKETAKLRKIQSEPRISIAIERHSEEFVILDLVVKNIGLGRAYNVQFSIVPDVQFSVHSKKLSQYSFLRRGISYLAPLQSQSVFLTLTSKIPTEEHSDFRIAARYTNFENAEQSETFHFFLEDYSDILRAGTPPLRRISDAISNLTKELLRLRSEVAQIVTKEAVDPD